MDEKSSGDKIRVLRCEHWSEDEGRAYGWHHHAGPHACDSGSHGGECLWWKQNDDQGAANRVERDGAAHGGAAESERGRSRTVKARIVAQRSSSMPGTAAKPGIAPKRTGSLRSSEPASRWRLRYALPCNAPVTIRTSRFGLPGR